MVERTTRCGQQIIPDPVAAGTHALAAIHRSIGLNEWTDEDWRSPVFAGTDFDQNTVAKIVEFWSDLDGYFSKTKSGFFWYPVETGKFTARFFYMPERLRGRVPDQNAWSIFGELATSNGLYWHRRAYGLVSDISYIKQSRRTRALIKKGAL